jgi:hypothetical protein
MLLLLMLLMLLLLLTKQDAHRGAWKWVMPLSAAAAAAAAAKRLSRKASLVVTTSHDWNKRTLLLQKQSSEREKFEPEVGTKR